MHQHQHHHPRCRLWFSAVMNFSNRRHWVITPENPEIFRSSRLTKTYNIPHLITPISDCISDCPGAIGQDNEFYGDQSDIHSGVFEPNAVTRPSTENKIIFGIGVVSRTRRIHPPFVKKMFWIRVYCWIVKRV